MFTTKSIFGLNVLAIASLFSTATAQTATSTTTAVSTIVTPTPTQPEMVDNCDAFYEVQTNDTCYSVSNKFDVALDLFESWNPSVGVGCPYLILGDWVCVDTTDYAPAATPSPIYSDTIDGCLAFYKVQPGDYCSLIAAETSITLAEFYTYNPGVGSDCSALALDHWVCVAA
ncbi:unnamed protein product [Discula destructiva]